MGIVVAATLAAWGLTIVKLKTLIQKRTDKRVVTLWLAFSFFSLAFTALLVSTGNNRPIWDFLMYLFFVVAVHFLNTSLCSSMEMQLPRWTTPFTVVVISLLAIRFIYVLSSDPPSGVRVPAIQILFAAYSGTMLISAGWVFSQYHHKEDSLPIRLRVRVVQVTVLLTITYFAYRIATTLFSFPLPNRLRSLILYSMFGITVLFWMLSFAPNKFYLALNELVVFCKKVRALRSLKRLQAALERWYPQVSSLESRWWHQIRDTDLYLYQYTIAIMDSRKELACCTSEEAAHIRRHLRAVQWDQDFDSLVDSLVKIDL